MKTLRGLLAIFIVFGIIFGCQKQENITPSLTSEDLATHVLKSTIQTDNLTQILTIVEGMVQNGELNKGNGNALISKINSAIKSIQKGQLKAAENVLNAFVNQVNSLVSDGVLNAVIGEQFTQLAYEVFNPPTWKCGDDFIDTRDAHSYKTMQIGAQCWMAENLAYLSEVNPPTVFSNTAPYFYVYDYYGTSVSEAKSSADYLKYGVLYNWIAAMDGSQGSNSVPSMIKGVCPTGWHLPSDNEWKVLEVFLGMSQEDADKGGLGRVSGNVGYQLESVGEWPYNTGSNTSGFSALPGGFGAFYGMFSSLGASAYFWTSTGSIGDATYRNLNYIVPDVFRGFIYTSLGFSVRCIKD